MIENRYAVRKLTINHIYIYIYMNVFAIYEYQGLINSQF